MAGGGNFFGRVFTYLANELIVNGLANRYLRSHSRFRCFFLFFD